MMKSYSVVHIEQKMAFIKFNSFFIDFLRYSFGRIKVISTVVEREYTPDMTWQIYFAYQLTGFYMIRSFTKRYFLTDYSYILENHFYFVNAPNSCFKLSSSSIVSSIQRSFNPYISHIIVLHIHYLQKERNRFCS